MYNVGEAPSPDHTHWHDEFHDSDSRPWLEGKVRGNTGFGDDRERSASHLQLLNANNSAAASFAF